VIYYFHWLDMLNDNKIRRIKRVDEPGLNVEVEFNLADLAPSENLRVLVLNDFEEHLGVILLKR